MINSNCNITFENDEISKEITLPCQNVSVTTQSCEVGKLVNGLCVYTICPDGYIDNGSDCIKETPSIETGIVFVPGRTWTGGAFGSFVTIANLSGGVAEITSVFPNFTRTGTMTFVIDGLNYDALLSSNIVGNAQLEFQNGSDPFAALISNNQFTYANQTILISTYPITVYWGGQTYTKQTAITCPVGTTQLNDKCYEVVDKIQMQEVATTNTVVQPQIALPQTITVAKGEIKSDISQAHANYLANELLNQRVAVLQPLCQTVPIYGNTLIIKTGKKDCTVGYSCDVTVSVTSDTFTSVVSQQDAQSQAQTELQKRFNLASPCCTTPTTYLSAFKQLNVEKPCDIGYTPNPQQLTVFIPEGGNSSYNNILIPAFTSLLSQEEADSKRDIWINTNLYLFKSQIQCVKIVVNKNCIQESTAQIMLNQQLQLQVGNDFVWTFIRASGDWNIDLTQIESELGQPVNSYKLQICSSIPSYIPTIGDLKNVVGDYVYVSNTTTELKMQYAIGNQLTIIPGNYTVTLLLKPSSVIAPHYYKYGYDNCCF